MTSSMALLYPGTEPASVSISFIAGGFFTTEPHGKLL